MRARAFAVLAVVYRPLHTHIGWPLGPAEREARLQRTMGGESGRVARGSVGGASVLNAIIISVTSPLPNTVVVQPDPLLPGLSVRWVLLVPRARCHWIGFMESLVGLTGGRRGRRCHHFLHDLHRPSSRPRAARPLAPPQLPAGTVPESCGTRRTYCTAPLPSSGGDVGAAGRRVGASGGERRARGPASTFAEISVPAPLAS
jgi:hypothetical protein